MSADTAYEQQNDLASAGDVQDNDYASRTGQNEIPVQKDDALIEDPIDPETADSDDTLGMWPSRAPTWHSELTCVLHSQG